MANSISSYENIAFLKWSDAVYFASEGTLPLETSITQLIEGIYELDSKNARRILRERIFTTQVPTAFCRGMVRVAAKRISVLESSEISTDLNEKWIRVPPLNFNQIPGGSMEEFGQFQLPIPQERSDTSLMRLALKLKDQIIRSGPLHQLDRPVAALLASAQNEPLWWALNSNHENKTRHAEINLIQSFLKKSGRPIPHGAKIFVTLKPCKMCAGLIWNSSPTGSRTQVIYAENDPGPDARGTILDPLSVERRYWSQKNDNISDVLQSQLSPI